MAEFRNDDEQRVEIDYAYVDGYGLEERLLEGVRFKVERMALGTGFHLVCNGVHPDDNAYMLKFNKQQKAAWCREAVKWLTENDGDATAEDGTNVHWHDDAAPAPQTVKPVQIGKANIDDILRGRR